MTIALWCVFAAGLLPYVCAFVAKTDRSFDNENPRAWLARQEGYRARANFAQQNSFEAFAFFAAAVIVAHMLNGPQRLVDLIALVFIGARVLYIAFYIGGKGVLRSLAWLIGMVSVVSIFIIAAL